MSKFDPKDLKPGTLMRQNKGTAAVTLKERKEDDTGWWVVEGGGLGDYVITDDTAGWTPDPNPGFSEQSLRQAIVNTWGPAGAHVDVYDHILATIASLQAENADLRASIGEVVEERDVLKSKLYQVAPGLFPAPQTCACRSSFARTNEHVQGCPLYDALGETQ